MRSLVASARGAPGAPTPGIGASPPARGSALAPARRSGRRTVVGALETTTRPSEAATHAEPAASEGAPPSTTGDHAADAGARSNGKHGNGVQANGAETAAGPSSSLSNTRATRKRKPARVRLQETRIVDPEQPGLGAERSRQEKEGGGLDDLNPYVMGRKSRALLDNVWQRFTSLGAPGRSAGISTDELDRVASIASNFGDFETPQAAVTDVLVLGATGRVGRILVRKLLLRGYPVTVLVRPGSADKGAFPESVKVVEGDVGDYATVRAAMRNVDKVIYCADARSTITADVKRVCEDGVLTAAKALQDERNNGITPGASGLTPFPSAKKRITGARESDSLSKRKRRWQEWQVQHVGPSKEAAQRAAAWNRNYAPTKLEQADTYINKRQNLIFHGSLHGRSSYATMGMELDMRAGGLAGTVGLIVRVKGDGQTYGVILTTEDGDSYMGRFTTTGAFQNVRIPYSAFRRMDDGLGAGPQRLDPTAVRKLAICFENRSRQAKAARSTRDLESLSSRADREFKLELNRIHALPDGGETDFILLSCAGVGMHDPMEQEKITTFKRAGEAALRASGLGYTIVRPGAIIDEPGGYKALVFDQNNRIQQSISRADVADVCVKSLHDSAARNKTFDVCHEYTPAGGGEAYELVAHLPNKANSYLTPALAVLEPET